MSAAGRPARMVFLRLALTIIGLAILVFLVDAISTFLVRTFAAGGLAYLGYVEEGLTAVIVAVGGYLVIRAVLDLVIVELTPRYGRGNTQLVVLVLRIVLYGFLVAAVLAALGFNLEGVVVGGAVGGLVLGLAIQSLATSALAGFFVSGTRTIQPGNHAILQSSIWGSFPGRVMRVGLLFTDAMSANGNVIKVPNSALVTSGTFTKLDDPGDKGGFSYPLQVTVSADVPADRVLSGAMTRLGGAAYLRAPGDVYLTAKNGATNVFTALLRVPVLSELNRAIDTTNRAFDESYWAAKAPPEPAPR
jgi:small-conductance mechanosensitive channel